MLLVFGGKNEGRRRINKKIKKINLWKKINIIIIIDEQIGKLNIIRGQIGHPSGGSIFAVILTNDKTMIYNETEWN